MPLSPTAEGFRAAFRRPSWTLGEITWRWVVGATAGILFFFGLVEYLDTLPITGGELLFLKSRQPVLVAEAIAHILRGSLARATLSIVVAATLLSILWMVAAAVGRAVTVNAIVGYFHSGAAWRLAEPLASDDRLESPLRSSVIPLFRLNFLRIALLLAALLALAAANILAGFASPAANPRPALAFLIFLPLAGLVLLCGWALNWLLSFATVLAARDGCDAIDSLVNAIALCRQRAGAVFAVSAWTAACHVVIFMMATTAASTLLGLAPLLKVRLAILLTAFVTLAYFAVADWIYMARLAGYLCLLEMPDHIFTPAPVPPAALPPVQHTIDRDELILSDLPGLAPIS